MSQAVAGVRRLPLDRWHRERGAALAQRGGALQPHDYGDAAAEYRLLRSQCGLRDRSAIARLELVGEDRQRFLHGMVSANISDLECGQSSFGFVTDSRGRVLADAVVHCLADRLWIELPAGRGSGIRSHLEHYVVADRIEVLPLDEMLPLAVLGRAASDCLGDVADRPLDEWWNCRRVIAGTEIQLSSHPRLGVPAVTIWTPASIADLFLDQLCEERELQPVGQAASETVRIEAGVGAWGTDYGLRNLPQETGAEDEAVDYEKGCYLGQEVVARLHYRGQPARQLRTLLLRSTGATPRTGTVWLDGRAAGELTSVAWSPLMGGWIGLAVVARRAASPGTLVELAGGASAEVSATPVAALAE